MTPEQASKMVDRLYGRLVVRRPIIKHRFEYLDGEHPLMFATEEWRKFNGDRYKDFSDNWCAPIVRSMVDRLRIDGFRIGSATDDQTPEEQQLWADWQNNEMAAQAQQGFTITSAAARSAVIVWQDGTNDGVPLMTWERPDQVAVEYDVTRRTRIAAIKAWVEDDTEYATLYTPNEIWKYKRPASIGQQAIERMEDQGFLFPFGFASEGGFQPRDTPGEPWPLKNPLGVVPVVEIQNQPRIGMEPLSDIDGAIAMQNAINVSWSYLFASADQASMAARVILGAPPQVPILNDQGEVVGTKPLKIEELQRGRFMFLPGATGIDKWDAATADYFTTIIKQAIAHLAAQTRTPGHYFLNNDSMANLNGDALTAAEVPLVSKCGTFQVHASPAVKEITALQAQVRGKDELAKAIRSTESLKFVQWKDPAMHSLAQVADAATKDRAVGMSLRTVLERRYGMTEPEINREFERINAEANDPALQAIVKGLAAGAAAAAGGGQ